MAAATATFDDLVAFNRRSAKSHSGIWRDLAVRKRKTEVRAQLGPIVEARPAPWRRHAADRAAGRAHPRYRGRPAAAGLGNAWMNWARPKPAGARSMNITFEGKRGRSSPAPPMASAAPSPRPSPRAAPGSGPATSTATGWPRRKALCGAACETAVVDVIEPARGRRPSSPRPTGGRRHRHPGQQCRRRARPGRPASGGDHARRTGRPSSTSM